MEGGTWKINEKYNQRLTNCVWLLCRINKSSILLNILVRETMPREMSAIRQKVGEGTQNTIHYD